MTDTSSQELENERIELLRRWEQQLEPWMIGLGFCWIVLIVFEFVKGLTPFFKSLLDIIWITFIIDFGLKLLLAPHKTSYLRKNWLTLIALIVPALRLFRLAGIFRTLRAAGAIRGVRMVRLVSSVNRGMGALSAALKRRGFAYVLGLTLMVTIVGAAGMYTFEHGESTQSGEGLDDFGTALWWTGMLITTMGSGYWPRSGAGRLLCLILSIYAFAVFGYVTAAVASFFIGRDAGDEHGELAGRRELEDIKRSIESLRQELHNSADPEGDGRINDDS